jgi:hypothetical protein
VDRERARHRLSKLLLRRGVRYAAGRPWTRRHYTWLRQVQFERTVARTVFEQYLLALEQIDDRIRTLDAGLAPLDGVLFLDEIRSCGSASATRECQSGSSSKRAATSVAFGSRPSPQEQALSCANVD